MVVAMNKFYSLRTFFLILQILNFIPKGIRGNQHCTHTTGELHCCDDYGENYYPIAYLTCYNIKTLSDELFQEYTDSHGPFKIFFLNSSLNKIPSLAFHKFSDLRVLYLNNTGISTMDMGAFIGLINLQELYLDKNNISEISIGTLNHLLELDTLDLSDNKLENLNKHVFKDLRNVKRLYLNKNKLQVLEEGLFSSLINAIEIDLSQNYLNILNVSVFHSLAELRLLNLSGNQIQGLSPSLFKDLTKLNVLDLSKNLLATIPFGILSGLNEVEYLNISHNHLTAIDCKSLYSLHFLTELNLAVNALIYLDAEELTSVFTKLKHIHLNDNNWTCDTLFTILKTFRIAEVVVESGNDYQANNLHGIHCTPSTSHLNEPIMTASSNKLPTNSTLTIDNGQIQLHSQRLLNILMEISEKISKNNNLIGKFIENVPENKMQKMTYAVNVTYPNISLLSNQHESDTIQHIHNTLLNLYNVLNTTHRDDMMIELVEAKHLLEVISRNSERMVHLQESTYQRQCQLNNKNTSDTTTYIENTNTSIFMDNIDNFMRNISDSIVMLHTRIKQLTAFQSSNQPKSELLQAEQTTASHVNENTSTLVICLSILVVILFIMLGVICFRNANYNYIIDGLRRFRSESRHNKSEIGLMNNDEVVLNTQI